MLLAQIFTKPMTSKSDLVYAFRALIIKSLNITKSEVSPTHKQELWFGMYGKPLMKF